MILDRRFKIGWNRWRATSLFSLFCFSKNVRVLFINKELLCRRQINAKLVSPLLNTFTDRLFTIRVRFIVTFPLMRRTATCVRETGAWRDAD